MPPLLPVSGMASPFAPGHMTADPHGSSDGMEGPFSALTKPGRGEALLCGAGALSGLPLLAGSWGGFPRIPCVASPRGGVPWA